MEEKFTEITVYAGIILFFIAIGYMILRYKHDKLEDKQTDILIQSLNIKKQAKENHDDFKVEIKKD